MKISRKFQSLSLGAKLMILGEHIDIQQEQNRDCNKSRDTFLHITYIIDYIS